MRNAILATVALCLLSIPADAATFRLINEAGDVEVKVSVWDVDDKKWTVLDPVDFEDGRRGWLHEEWGKWLADPSFRIQIPARKSAGDLKVDLVAQTIGISFGVRAMYDPQEIEVPIELIPSVTFKFMDEVMFLGVPDVYRKTILSAQLLRYFEQVKQLRTKRVENIATAWFDTVLGALKLEDPDSFKPIRFDPHMKDSLARAVDESIYSRQFASHFAEWQTIFWKVPKDVFPYIIAAERCDIAPLALAYVIQSNTNFPFAAKSQGIPDVPAQLAFMQGEFERVCLGTTTTASFNDTGGI
jgi:hypothetical protein